jgi:hypothetical protein
VARVLRNATATPRVSACAAPNPADTSKTNLAAALALLRGYVTLKAVYYSVKLVSPEDNP